MITAALVLLALSASQQQNGVSVQTFLDMASRGNSARQLVTAAKQQPDSLREAFARTLFASLSTPARLTSAHRLANAYATAWADSFFIRQIARFESWSPARRRAKLAADSLRKAGNDALGQRGVPAALRLWRMSLQQATRARDTVGLAATLGNIGAGFYRAGQLDSAEVYLRRARTIAAAMGDLRTTGNAIGTLASISKDRGKLAEAADLYTQASALRDRSGDGRGLAADQNNLGMIARDLGDLNVAARAFERAFALNKSSGRAQPSAFNLTNLGGVASMLGEFGRAEDLYTRAFALHRGAGDDSETAYVLHERALVRVQRGDYPGAMSDLRAAARTHEVVGAWLDAAAVWRDLAAVLISAGDPQGALRALRTGEARAQKAGGVPDEMQADFALTRAEVAVELNALEQASEYYATAEKLYRSVGDDFGLAEVAHGRAALLYSNANFKAALTSLLAAERAHARSGDRRSTAITQLSIGYTQIQLNDSAAARATIGKARHELRGLGDRVGEAAALQALGDLALARRAPAAAAAHYREGIARLTNLQANGNRWRLHAGLGTALRMQGAIAPAIEQLRTAAADIERSAATLVTEERRIGFMADKLDVYTQLALAERQRGNVHAAFMASERMRAQHMLSILARGRVAVTRPESGHEQDLRRQIATLMRTVDETDRGMTEREPSGRSRTMPPAHEALYRAQSSYARLLTEIREQDPAYSTIVNPSTVPAASIARQLRSDEVMIDYLVTDSTTLAFVISRERIAVVDLSIARRTLVPLVDFAVRISQKPTNLPSGDLWRAPLTRLYAYLIAPLEAGGYLAGKRSLIIVPHAELHFLPFAALVNATTGRFLINHWDLTYAPSASVWHRLRGRSAQRKATVLALAPRTDVLPFSRAEVDAVRQGYGKAATVLVGNAASKRALRVNIARAGILHLATIGLLNKHNPLFSFVELSGNTAARERLEVHEVFGLPLKGQLVVLSACQTGLASGAFADVPPGDDWMGLVQAFLTAGAGGVVAALWPVNDRATAQLMARFHDRLRAGSTDAAALAAAQRAAIRNAATRHPFYWAAFTLQLGQR